MKRKKGSRGAAFVEALIVISVFVIFLLGIVYFRELYLAKMRAQRLARAGALAHAMAACKTDVNVTLKSDLPAGMTLKQSTPKDAPSATDVPRPVDSGSSSQAGQAFDRVTSKHGGTVLNRVDATEISGSAQATSRPDPLGPETGFRGTVSSGSYVSCGDELTNEPFSGIVDQIHDLFAL